MCLIMKFKIKKEDALFGHKRKSQTVLTIQYGRV